MRASDCQESLFPIEIAPLGENEVEEERLHLRTNGDDSPPTPPAGAGLFSLQKRQGLERRDAPASQAPRLRICDLHTAPAPPPPPQALLAAILGASTVGELLLRTHWTGP